MSNNAAIDLQINPRANLPQASGSVAADVSRRSLLPGWSAPTHVGGYGAWMLVLLWILPLGSWSLASAADWPQWGGRNMRNMYSPEKGLPDNFGKVEFKPGTEDIDPKSVKNLKW